MHQHQPVNKAAGQWPGGIFAEDRDIGPIGRPWHDALLARHQADDPPCMIKIRAQKRHGKAESRHIQPLFRRPEINQLAADRSLRDSAQRRAVIEIPEFLHVEMHCSMSLFGRWSSHSRQ